jgi:glycine oxidase
MKYDVAIVGAGIVGAAVAREVAQAGASVVILDRDLPGGQASWAAAGMLAPQAESDGPGTFLDLLLRARGVFPDLVRALEAETGIGLGYRSEGALLVAVSEEDEAELADRYEWQRGAGLPVEQLSGSEARRLEPVLSPATRTALRFAGDHQIDNRMLTKALWFSAAAAGAEVRLSDRVAAIRVDPEPAVELEHGTRVEASKIVLAAGSWSALIAGLPRRVPVEPVHGQLISITAGPPLLRHVCASPRGYLVPRSDGRVIAGATIERLGYRTQVTAAGIHRVTSVLIEIAPKLADHPIDAHWAGLRPGTPDGLPILGPDPEHPELIYATGHYRNGILLGPLTGRIIAAVALGREPEVDLEPYSVTRFG